MTTPNLDAETQQTTEQEPEGILRMREDFSPEKVEEILASIRKAADDPDKGEWMTLGEFMENTTSGPKMLASNRVRVHPDATAQIHAIRPDIQSRANGLLVHLAFAPSYRRTSRLDIGMTGEGGLSIWAHQDTEFWVYYFEEANGGLNIPNIWER